MPTIVSQIEVAENEIAAYEHKLDTLERRLRVKDLTDEQAKSTEKEEKDLKKKLKDKEVTLQGLRKENGKTTVVSFVILGLIVLVYYVFWVS